MPPASKTWRLTRAAEGDLAEIWKLGAKKWSAQQADHYHNNIIDMISELAAGVRHGRKIEFDGSVYLFHPCGSHHVFFRDERTRIVVVRILHQRMDFQRHL